MSKPPLRVKIYGSRGSYSPTTSNPTSIGVNTTCLRVDLGKNTLIFDAGSGIINLGRDLLKEIHSESGSAHKWKMNLFFTHLHIDHLVGFPYFAMLYFPKSEISIMGPRILDYEVAEVLDSFMHPPLFPVSMDDLPFKRDYYQVAESRVTYFYENNFEMRSVTDPEPENWLGRVSCMRNYMHPKGGSYFYKIETREQSIVFASDTEGFVGGDKRLIKFAEGADILFHDAQYRPEDYGMFQGFGHSTFEMACDVAEKAGVRKLLLFHHDPKHDDETLQTIEREAQKIFPETFLASEDMEFAF